VAARKSWLLPADAHDSTLHAPGSLTSAVSTTYAAPAARASPDKADATSKNDTVAIAILVKPWDKICPSRHLAPTYEPAFGQVPTMEPHLNTFAIRDVWPMAA